MKTTVTTTAKGVLPYHFVCNYCGARCDRTVDVVGNAYGGRENRAGALADLGNEPERYRKKIRDYRQRLTAGKALPAGKYDPVEYSASSLLSLGLDGVCTRCGRVQAWAIDPSGSGDKARKGCLRILLFDLLGLALFLIGALLTNGTAGAVLMVLGGAVFVVGIAGSLISMRAGGRRATKKKLAELAAAPNDPEKLPVIDA